MKFILALFFYSFLGSSISAQSASIAIVLANIEVSQGTMNIGVFENKTDFQLKEKPIAEKSILVTDTMDIKTTFKLPFGKFAIAVYHDENSDAQLNKKKLGIPDEGIGFSGKSLSKFKQPKFEEASFQLKHDTTISIYLKYPTKKD